MLISFITLDPSSPEKEKWHQTSWHSQTFLLLNFCPSAFPNAQTPKTSDSENETEKTWEDTQETIHCVSTEGFASFFLEKTEFQGEQLLLLPKYPKNKKKVGSLESVYVPENFYSFCSSIFGSTTLGHPHRIRTRVTVISVVEWNSWHLTMFFDGCQCTKVSIPHPPPKWPPSCGW